MEQKTKKENKSGLKTYGVYGLMEWQIHIPTGYSVKPFIVIHFEGGHVTGYGVAPALYSTSDPFIQRLIENTRWFKENKILTITSDTAGQE